MSAALDNNPKTMQQNNFTWYLDQAGKTTLDFILKIVKTLFWILYTDV